MTGGIYLLLLAVSSISFGTLVDQHRKLTVMRIAALFTLVLFSLAAAVFAVVLTALAFGHLLTVRMPEEAAPAPSDAHGGFGLIGSWRAVTAVSGLFALILFSTFNNFIGGVYLALVDPYGVELFSV